MPPIDDVTTRNGAAHAGRRRPRPRRGTTGEDDRPRGFEPDRMRRLWSDIDHARDNLGLGPETAAPATEWSVGGALGYAATLATDVVGAVVELARALPDPRRAIGDALPCVRRLPLVGGLFE